MPLEPLAISVTSGADRLSQREQITQVLGWAQEKGQPVRVRLPFTLYDTDRSYVFIRDATWNLELPSAALTPETIEQLIQTIGRCIVAIATQGSDAVLGKLEG